MIVVATDAPLSHRNLMRMARRTMFGMARCGSFMSNGSGDYAIAFSTSGHNENAREELSNGQMNPIFLAVVESTEEAIYNSMLMATTTEGREGNRIEAISVDQLRALLEQYNLLNLGKRLPQIR